MTGVEKKMHAIRRLDNDVINEANFHIPTCASDPPSAFFILRSSDRVE